MKKVYTSALLLCITLTSIAQVVITPKGTKVFIDSSKWQISGANIYNKNAGNIGIGTASPTAQLHTTGTVRFQGIGTNTVNTNIVTTDASGNVTTRNLSNLLSGNSITSLNGLTNSIQTIATGTTGTDFNITSAGTVHTFNLPNASATSRGALSSADWTTFNNKISAVTATTPAAVTTTSGNITINNTSAFWNAGQLQGKNIAVTAPSNGQVLTFNTSTGTWEPAAAAPVTTTVSNTNTAPNSLTTTVNGITGTAVPIVNSVSNTLAGNNLTTTVNGVTGTAINLSAIIPATTHSLAISGNTLTSTVNGVAATSNSVSSVSNTSSVNNLTTTVNGVAATSVPIINSIGNSSSANNLTTTVNGITGTAVPIVNTIANSLSGNNLTTTVNGVASTPISLASIVPATTHSLALSGNTLTSTVNGVAATSNSVGTVSNTSTANALTTTVNGVAAASVPIINSIANSLSGNNLTTTVNGVTSTPISLAAIVPATTNTLALSGNTLTSTVNGVAATSNSVGAVSNTSSINSLTTTVNGITGASVPIVNSISNASSANNLTTTVNGVTSTAIPIINTIANSLSGNNLTTTVNGVASTPVSLAAIVPATTNTLTLSGNTLTSTINGVAAASNSVSTVSNTSAANALTTTVNGVAGSAVNIINSNALTLTGGALTSTVNGVASSAVNVLATANNGLTATSGNVQLGGTLTQATTISTSTTNTLAVNGLQNGTSTDSLLVISTGTGGIIKKIAAPQSFPQLLVDVRRTTTYTPGTTFATLVYNSVNINAGAAYNTTTGSFTAPATGMYQVIVNNGYKWVANTNGQIVNQIIVNGAVDMEISASNFPTNSTNSTVVGNTIVSLTANQTISIAVGSQVGTPTTLVGAGQHVLKIIRLQ